MQKQSWSISAAGVFWVWLHLYPAGNKISCRSVSATVHLSLAAFHVSEAFVLQDLCSSIKAVLRQTERRILILMFPYDLNLTYSQQSAL